MKLKQLPEDFKVEEVSNFLLSDNADYKLYSLEKKGIESFYVFNHICKQNSIPNSMIGVAGLKDKHAFTKQYFTIPSKYNIKSLKEKNFSIEFIGYVEKPIKAGELQGNKFIITVRDVRKGEISGIQKKSLDIMQIGVPNYFDSQRFGSVVDKEFIVKFVLQKDFEKAVKSFLTKYSRSEKKSVKDDKRLVLAKWGNFNGLRLRTKSLANVVDEYNRTKDWSKAYNSIPINLRQMFVSAYQSYLWNECIKELLRKNIDKNNLHKVQYNIGSLVFYKNVDDKEIGNLPRQFSLIAHDMEMDENEGKIIMKVLQSENIEIKDFDIKSLTGTFFKAQKRDVIVYPKDFKISEPMVDEVNDKGKKNRFKFVLEFELGKGSYATIITKKLFNQ